MSVARRKGMLAAVVLQLVLLAAPLVAQEDMEKLFPAQPTGYLTDAAGVVDPASAARIESIGRTLREKTGAELAVVTLPTLGRYEASDVALVIGRRWGVGAKAEVGDKLRNAGVIMLLVPKREGQAGKIRLEVGDGLQGVLTDATSGRIRDAMRPVWWIRPALPASRALAAPCGKRPVPSSRWSPSPPLAGTRHPTSPW